MAWAPGKQLQGDKYTIKKVIGHGRFGITYLARDKNNNAVVIKTPNDEALNRPDFERLQQVFVQEAFKLVQCRHPHIVRAEEPFQEDGMWCIAMEHIQGVDLASRTQAILPEEEALSYIQQIGEALIEVHKNRFLHRDVRPANIMLRAGKPKAVLIDFGLAREFDHDLTVTRIDEISKGFAAPELYSRQNKRGPYTDVYSLGATLYELLTGKVPASAKKRVLQQATLKPPQEINPQISNGINRAILWAMELKAKDRPKSIQDWLSSLDLKSDASEPTSLPQSKTDHTPPQPKVNWATVWTAVGSVAAVFATVLALWQIFQELEPKSQPSPKPNTKKEIPLPEKKTR